METCAVSGILQLYIVVVSYCLTYCTLTCAVDFQSVRLLEWVYRIFGLFIFYSKILFLF
jgi:hypothetical protein